MYVQICYLCCMMHFRPLRNLLVKTSLVVVLAGGITACEQRQEPPQLYPRLKDVSRLTLAEMSVNKMGSVTDMTAARAKTLNQKIGALVASMKIGDRVGVYSYHTYLQAFIDLSELSPDDVEITPDGICRLTLPPIQTQYLGRDVGLTEEHYRVTGLRSNIKSEERARLKEVMNEVLKQEIEDNPEFRRRLEIAAEAKARGYFTVLLRDWGYESEIKFRK